MENIKITHPISKSADITKLTIADLSTEHSQIFQALNDNNDEKINSSINQFMSFLRTIPAFKEFYDNIPQLSKRFEVIIPKEIQKKILSGDYKMSDAENNSYFAQIKDTKTGRIVHNLRLKDIHNVQDASEHLKAMHNVAVMQTLNQISMQLEAIEKKLIQIHKEFNNDRIGKIQAGYSLFLDAQQLNDKELRYKLLSSAISLLVEGRSQLLESSKVRIDNIETGFLTSALGEFTSWNFSASQKENSKELVKEIFYIQRSSQILLFIYSNIDEYNAMLQSIAPFHDLIKYINNEMSSEKLEEWDTSQKWSVVFSNVMNTLEQLPQYENLPQKKIEIEIIK